MNSSKVAVIGYGLRVPGANNPDDFWHVISNGRDVITRAQTNVGATAKDRVHAYGLLEDFDKFDEEYFGYSPKEAADIDPQQRLLLMCAVEALESAGISWKQRKHEVGVWASTGLSGYLLETIDRTRAGLDATNQLVGSDGHYAATRIAYKLGLTGPAMSIGSACSSSLLAVHTAAQAIIGGECDLALAGGMDIEYPVPTSYLYQEGGILSSTGICKPFDDTADGTVFGSGGGMVLLADYDLAEKNGWPIFAELAGTAANNDGSNKASFTAPKPDRQAEVIELALAVATCPPSSVAYMECHGTGTLLGDQSELEALGTVFGPESEILLGSSKANFGHLRVGAGVIGLIKVCESFSRGQFPPLANCDRPIRSVDKLGFKVPKELTVFDPNDTVVAGVSSFGFGGTNVHAVLRNPSVYEKGTDAESTQPVVLEMSSRNPDLCIEGSVDLADYLKTSSNVSLSALAKAMRSTRSGEAYRLAVVAEDQNTAIQGLHADPDYSIEGWASEQPLVTALLSGQQESTNQLALCLWEWEPVFTSKLSSLCEFAGITYSEIEAALQGRLELSLGQKHALHAASQIALMEQLRARGVNFTQTAGYSLGEYAAAAVAGAEDEQVIMSLLLERGRILEAGKRACLLVVAESPDAIQRLVGGGVFTAIRISERRTLVGVSIGDTEAVQDKFERLQIPYKLVRSDYGYHTPLLLAEAATFNDSDRMSEPDLDTIWTPTLRGGANYERSYWSRHLDSTLDFRKVSERMAEFDGSKRLITIDTSDNGLLGKAVARSSGVNNSVQINLSSETTNTRRKYLQVLSRLWVAGCEIDTSVESSARSLRLPNRSWDLKKHIKPSTVLQTDAKEVTKGNRQVRREVNLDNWAYHPSWSLKPRRQEKIAFKGQRWLLFVRDNKICRELVTRLEAQGVEVVTFTLEELPNLTEATIKRMISELNVHTSPIDRVVHLWASNVIQDPGRLPSRLSQLDNELESGFYALLFAFQELAERQGAKPIHLDIVAKGIHPVLSANSIPERSLLLGPAIVLPQDYPFVTGRSIDITELDENNSESIFEELWQQHIEHSVALERGLRWIRTYEQDILPRVSDEEMPQRLRDRGVYLITGGLGGIGMTLAEFLVRKCRARVVLTGLGAVTDEEHSGDSIHAERRAQIQRLEDLGGEVMVARCDVASSEETRQLFAEIDKRFGPLNGVIHAAGVFETQRAFRSIAETGAEDCMRRLLPKVHGTLVLAEFLRGRDLDFIITQSSLSSQLGGLGFYAYTAGNAFMDAYTESNRSSEAPWMTVNWDGWIFRERGEDEYRQSVVSPSFASPDFGVVAEIAVRPSEGAEIYGRLMHAENPRQVLISTADFNARVNQWINADHSNEKEARQYEMSEWKDETSKQVVRAWQDILGVGSLAPDDNFFAKGGDSLLGVSLAHRLSVDFGVVFSAITLFENATLGQMINLVKGNVN